MTRLFRMLPLLALLVLTAPPPEPTDPTLPQLTVDDTVPTVNGTTFTASACTGAGVGIQDRINAAAAADGNLTHEVVIDSSLRGGSRCVGQFTPPYKTGANPDGTGWIIVRSSSSASLPAKGTRIVPATHTQYMPEIAANNTTTGGWKFPVKSHHWYFIGINTTNSVTVQLLINIDPGATVTTDYPHHIVFNRSYIHGDLTVGSDVITARCVQIGGNYIALSDNVIDNCVRTTGADTQTFGGWNFQGPLKVDNNTLGDSTEHFIFGGSSPVIATVVPSDITITRNYFYKPSTGGYFRKNMWECKNCQRVLLEGNKVYNYREESGGQHYALQFTPAFQSGAVPQARVQDITGRWNHFAGMSGWSNHNYTSPGDNGSSAGDGTNVDCSGYPSQIPVGCLRARRQRFHDNLVEGVSGSVYGGTGVFIQILGPVDNLAYQHNTFIGDATGSTPAFIFVYGYGPPSGANRYHANFTYRSNIVYYTPPQALWCAGATANSSDCLVWGTSGTRWPTNPNYAASNFTNNVIVGAPSANYPPNNNYPAGPMPGNIAFVNYASPSGGDYSLSGSSPYLTTAHDGGRAGISNSTTWANKTCGAESGDWSCVSGSPAPTVSSITPTSGTYAGGTSITNLAGTGFQVGATITFGGVAATSVVVVSSTQITCTTPAHAAGAVNVVVTNPDLQSATLTNGYTYTGSGAPTISSLATSQTNAARGSTFGDYTLTITGTGFAQGATVLVDGRTCGGVVVTGTTSIACTVLLRNAPGAVDVTVTNPDAQAATSVGGFTYTKPVAGRP